MSYRLNDLMRRADEHVAMQHVTPPSVIADTNATDKTGIISFLMAIKSKYLTIIQAIKHACSALFSLARSSETPVTRQENDETNHHIPSHDRTTTVSPKKSSHTPSASSSHSNKKLFSPSQPSSDAPQSSSNTTSNVQGTSSKKSPKK